MQYLRRFLTHLGTLTAHPTAFLVVCLYAVAWFVFRPETLEWHAVATLATWWMTLLIQRAEHRDTQAIQAKLDELLRTQPRASESLAHIDRKEPEEIERARGDR